MSQLWVKNGGHPQPLPFQDHLPDGSVFTNLINNPEGRAALGWVQSATPAEVSRMQAKQYLLDIGMLDLVDAAIRSSGNARLVLYWTDASTFHRDHPQIAIMAAGFGWNGAQLDNMFTQAKLLT